ncbi:hypothetical protein GBF35_16420 [Nonomuraea phyllanthi]|uniref:HEPN domain-containing protein n=1 Tax=Nonomuraea phyllanthi TaxID=2219224 RepID=UPI00116D2D1F|nr:HEPN domain-containing protein [Nonomuraea phyllanthi]QFY08052.1 hypothetical protein GBF35_16420 [Nonomuraea phyllanthi]
MAQLKRETRELDKVFLKSVLGQPPTPLAFAEEAAVCAFLVLSHGAVEEFVEAAFKDYVQKCFTLNSRQLLNRASHLIMIQFAADAAVALEQTRSSVPRDDAVIRMVPALYERKICGTNNGVRTHNIKKLVTGAGLVWDKFENDCSEAIAALDALGARRGDIAHSSAANRAATGGVSKALYPKEARELVNTALAELSAIVSFLASPKH